MKFRLSLVGRIMFCSLLVGGGVAQGQIRVTKARIGCLDIQTDGNLTGVVARACNNRQSCSYKAPTPDQYKREGVQARTRSFCTQGMEITYQCGNGPARVVAVPGDAWNHPPAELVCEAPPPPPPPPGSSAKVIAVQQARIGCLDIQPQGNLTGLVSQACNNRQTCSYKAPTPQEYTSRGVHAATRTFCTQGMEITYGCGPNDFHTVSVPGDAWNNPPALLDCSAAAPPAHAPTPDAITVSQARIGCLDIQKEGNLTGIVGRACDGKKACSFKAPTQDQYTREGVHAATRTFCTQGMEITYQCGHNDFQTISVPGDAWNQPPAELLCNPAPLPANHVFPAGAAAITVTKARIGCLDIQLDGNLTKLVAQVCDDRGSCSYKAPTQDAYQRAGVQAKTRTFCTQAMEITYRCGQNDDQVVTVPGDAWNHPPAELDCEGRTIAMNHQDVTPPPQGTPSEPACKAPRLAPPDYYIAPRDMLDWTPTQSQGDYTFIGFRPPQPATQGMYDSPPTSNITGAPGSTLGANEGRVRAELRAAAAKKDPLNDLCQAAQRFTRNGPASANAPADRDFGNAFADLSVTGKAVFERFVQFHPNEATLHGNPGCAGASANSLTTALNRAYQVAKALRGPHASPERQALGWIAVSGEDDQPYRPVNVPTNSGKFPEFQIRVNVPRFNIPVNTRYMIAHAQPPAFQRPPSPLVDGGPGRQVPADLLPALAPDAQVILFIHGMDSRLEEADDLTEALHHLGGKNWTVISLDLPTSGYADNIDHRRISPISAVACHVTPVVDFIEEFIVAFVDTLDGQLHGQLKPKIKAVVGGSLGGNMAMRLGRRPNTPWITNVVPWSPAAIWPSMIAQRNAVAAGCDTGWDMLKDRAVNQSLKWGGLEDRFLPDHETPELRRELFYGGFDWSPVGGLGGPPQAQCWFSDKYQCKKSLILGSRIDRQETYDANFRAWHWRLGAEQLAFSQQQFAPGTQQPLYLLNTKRMLLFCGYEDTCGGLGQYTRQVAAEMVNTPGYARFLKQTGHSLDNEHPNWIARQIADFLK
ncbi:MAG TPA: alpha/beta hydrolase [Candidatus Acidoferrales bacterium]|nr:alpha/beta hydrolase [Candidatus Acidoferrales bacterium]